MASLSFLATTTLSSSSLYRPSVAQPPSASNPRRLYTCRCESSSSHGDANTTNTRSSNADNNVGESRLLQMDRRNILLGLGGLYGAATSLGRNNTATASPVQIPDLSKCHLADGGTGVGKVQCCPPYTDSSKAINFTFPSTSKPIRVRKAAHLLEAEEVAKYKEAIAKMKALPEDDPRSFMQYANVHCQYCNGAYYQKGYETDQVELQVHNGWLFLPWHRFYIHFYERILGSLIGDDSFALPFWNWDAPDGMMMPDIFADTNSSLYNDTRNPKHLPKTVMDFNYSYYDDNPAEADVPGIIQQNLLKICNAYKESIDTPLLFMGEAIRAGEASDSTDTDGNLESIHNIMHIWTGPDDSPHMDMGNFFSAGRDPIFYCHHSNVDRMWQIYRNKRGHKVEFDDTDWLESTFLFVDENKQLVKVKVKDSFNPLKLRYTYDDVPLLWTKPGLRKKVVQAKKKATGSTVTVSEFGTAARTLDSTIRVLVSRPKTSRSKTEKEEAVEVLVISGIKAPMDETTRFNVYVTIPSGKTQVEADLGDFAGSFIRLPHHGKSKEGQSMMKRSNLKLGITNLLEDLKAEAAEKLVVSLVPATGTVTIGGVGIELVNTDATSA